MPCSVLIHGTGHLSFQFFRILFDFEQNYLYFCNRKNKGVPHGLRTDGLRLYPANLMRLVPPKGLLLLTSCHLVKKQLFVFTCKFIN